MRTRLIALVLSALATVACEHPSSEPMGDAVGGCVRDTECKGDRICERGRCGPAAAPVTATPSATVAAVTVVASPPAASAPCPACSACPPACSPASGVAAPAAKSARPSTPREMGF